MMGSLLDGRTPFAACENPPRLEACFGDNGSPGLGLRQEMRENQRMAPGHRPPGRADRLVFVAVRVFHQDRADQVGPELARKAAPHQPFALEVAADLRPFAVNPAPAADAAIPA